MVALEVDSPEKVDILHQKAIELGADSEGEPGPRGEGGFYAGYFRDLDGNKLSAFYMGPRLSAVFERVEGRSEVRRRRDRTIGRKS